MEIRPPEHGETLLHVGGGGFSCSFGAAVASRHSREATVSVINFRKPVAVGAQQTVSCESNYLLHIASAKQHDCDGEIAL